MEEVETMAAILAEEVAVAGAILEVVAEAAEAVEAGRVEPRLRNRPRQKHRRALGRLQQAQTSRVSLCASHTMIREAANLQKEIARRGVVTVAMLC